MNLLLAMNIPNNKECEEIIKYFNVPDKVIQHSKLVWKICQFIAKQLIKRGIKINIKLLKAATDLHDIDKIQTLKTEKHALIAYDYLKNKYPEVAEIVVSHVMRLATKYPSNTWEKKILFYFDKITQDEKVVLFEERIEFLHKRGIEISEKKIELIKKTIPIVKKI